MNRLIYKWADKEFPHTIFLIQGKSGLKGPWVIRTPQLCQKQVKFGIFQLCSFKAVKKYGDLLPPYLSAFIMR